ncbi:hypothetical protein JKP88DRAFT_349039 [Tribonema minus]|uniref:Uncharacterized protein n=1 Tax=Tribonema minus TaxID=303371 RepID=A0A835YWU0_9STRA|nr:hypothetical protein JKP88DRAFT_349039 [Tribonema minus]
MTPQRYAQREAALEFVLRLVPGQWLYAAAVCRQWRNLYSEVFSDTCTYYTSAASSSQCLQYAFESGLKLAERDFHRAAGSHGSIDTIQLARSLGMRWSPDLCTGAARTGRVELLRWLRAQGCPWNESMACPWTESVAGAADALTQELRRELDFYISTGPAGAGAGPVPGAVPAAVLPLYAAGARLLHARPEIRAVNGSSVKRAWGYSVAMVAAARGDIAVLQWVWTTSPWTANSYYICNAAARHGQLAALQWMLRRGCLWDVFKGDLVTEAARNGHLNMLKWLRAMGFKFGARTVQLAVRGGHFETVKWLHKEGAEVNAPALRAHAAAGGSVPLLRFLDEAAAADAEAQAVAAAQLAAAVDDGADSDDDDGSGKAAAVAAALEAAQAAAAAAVASSAQLNDMLLQACIHGRTNAAAWLRARGAQWPERLWTVDTYGADYRCFRLQTLKWAIAEGCPWGPWPAGLCQSLRKRRGGGRGEGACGAAAVAVASA